MLVAAGNTLLGVSDQTSLPVVSPLVGKAGETVANIGTDLGENGLGGTPVVGGLLQNTVNTADGAVGALAGVTVVDLPILTGPTGSTPAIGVSALSSGGTPGSVLDVNALPSGAQQLANVSLGGTQVLGQAGTPGAVNSNLNPGTGSSNPLGGSGPVGGALSGVTNAAGGVVSGLTAGAAGGGTSGSNPLSGLTGGAAGGAVGGITGGITTPGGSAGGSAGGGAGGGIGGFVGSILGGLH